MAQRPIVFDLFHTLVDPDDFRPAGFRRLAAAASVLGVEYGIVAEEWERALPDLVRGRDSVRGLLRRVAHANGRPARTLDISIAAEPLGRYQELALLHPQRAVLDLLDGLDGRLRAVLTNCHDRDVEAWSRSPLSGRIDHAVFSTRIGAAKPELAAYLAVLDVLAVSPADACYVGNGGDDELAGAKAAGFGMIVHFAAFDDARGRTSPAERAKRAADAHFSAASLPELAEILER